MKEILTVCTKELLDNIRDRRTLMTAILMPIILMPIILIGSFKLQEYQIKQAEEKVAIVALSDQAVSPVLTEYLKSQDKIELAPTTDYAADIEAGTLALYIEVPESFQSSLDAEVPTSLIIHYKSSKTDSTTALTKVMAVLESFNQIEATQRLTAKGLDPQLMTSVIPQAQDIASAEERGGFFVGFLLPMFIVIFAIVGGMYVAIDVSAGEKERKTLEALLLVPISRFKIVMGKYLAVTVMAVVTIMLSIASLYTSFRFYTPSLGAEGDIVINLTPGAIGVMLGIGAILAVMFSGLLLSVAIFAKSYKEAQNYISPFYLLAVLPVGIANSLPSFQPSLIMFVIPGMNAVFVMKEVLLGIYDWPHIVVTLVSLLVFAGAGIIVASKIYSREGILFRD
ncbi:MAG: ABC transporter permease [Candidatus Kerfeldbacteria bacterium]|nr:ABC transporter permease [Candidatus Kerfeldbacteria bacterium]